MKKFISTILVLSIVLSICSFPTSAAPTSIGETPWWVSEGETWVPANGIMPLEEGVCNRTGHLPPSGYRYEGYTVGNTFLEGVIGGGFATLTSWVPGIGWITSIISTALLIDSVVTFFKDGKKMRVEYYKYTYKNSSGQIWYHVVWHNLESGGNYAYVACEIGRQ